MSESERLLLSGNEAVARAARDYQVAIRIEGDQISVTLDGIPILAGTCSLILTSGTVAVFNEFTKDAGYDNIQVVLNEPPLPLSPPPPPPGR